MAIDCLFEFKTWKETVSDVSDLLTILNTDINQNNREAYFIQSKEAVNKAKTYFMPVDSQMFLRTVLKKDRESKSSVFKNV